MQKLTSSKVGVGLITCDRPDFFKKSYKSIEYNYNISFVVVDDGENSVRDLVDFTEDGNTHYIKTKGKEGVAVAKNKALKYLLDCECEHLFLIEDDIEIVDHFVFQAYINSSIATGIKHFNFGLHGNHNTDSYGNPIVRKTVNYGHSEIDLYYNVLGAFSYYRADILKDCGLMDERFYNALEHVDHTYQIINKGYHPPFRWFADITDSKNYLKDIVPDHQQSKIRNESNFQEIFKNALDIFIQKNNFSVISGYGPQEKNYSEKEVIESLKNIYKNHV
jgi:GT2 family glycosyltransferase